MPTSPISNGIDAANTVASALGSPIDPVRRPLNPAADEVAKPYTADSTAPAT